MTATHVKANANSTRIPAAASHAKMPAPLRNPIKSATRKMITRVAIVDTSEVSTCAQSTEERLTGIALKRANSPFCISPNSLKAV
jgi:hypothetical protein